ncbi:protein rolling stone [Drosophila innubila]|uniref:protein rolling stone n=1 Tax=Drosophila innubila TaxID=198719 RepID=UPI00148C9445|nr:protein rolling stone [Drosophila innubila]
MTQSTELRQEPLKLREELQIRSIGLHHHAPEDFFRSQWQTELQSCRFLIYRWSLAAFFGTGVISYLILFFKGGTVFIYLTNWNFILCGVTSISGAIFVSIHHRDSDKMVTRRCLVKCYWACYWINLILSHIVSIVYWFCLYRDEPKRKLIYHIYNIWIHAMPLLLFTVDHMLVAHPSRLMHFLYPLLLAMGYAGFSYVYYLLGGLDPFGRTFIYKILDYEKPSQALKNIGWISVLLVCCSALQYGVYRLRVFIARKLGKLQ